MQCFDFESCLHNISSLWLTAEWTSLSPVARSYLVYRLWHTNQVKFKSKMAPSEHLFLLTSGGWISVVSTPWHHRGQWSDSVQLGVKFLYVYMIFYMLCTWIDLYSCFEKTEFQRQRCDRVACFFIFWSVIFLFVLCCTCTITDVVVIIILASCAFFWKRTGYQYV